MKPSFVDKALTCLVVSLLLALTSSYGQCQGNVPAEKVTYDTTVTGGGNDLYEFTFPQFDPNIGTLQSLTFQTTITLKYGFELENTSLTSSVHKVVVTRADEIYYPGGFLDMPLKSVVLGSYPLSRTDHVQGSGPDYIEKGPFVPLSNFPSEYDLVENQASFLGNGTVTVSYKANSLASVNNINSSLGGYAEDTIHFEITYSYCPASSLPADVNSFKATRLTTGLIELSWFTPDELAGSKYELQKSTDASVFTSFHYITATRNTGTTYRATYAPTAADKNKLFFRIKEFETNGQPRYSPVKSVTLNSTVPEPVKIFPTLANSFIRINFPVTDKDDWQVNIISLAGQTVQQLNVKNTTFVKVMLNSNIRQGLYIVETKNKRTLQSQRTKIIVQ